MQTSGVYGWHNRVSDKWYVGSSVHIERRKVTHLKELGRGTHTGVKLLRAWNKYGVAAWDFAVLETCEPLRQSLLEREQHWIDKLNSYKHGYNTLPMAGRGSEGRKPTPEQIAKTKATRMAHGGYGHTEATKKLIGDLQRGKPRGPMTDAHKQSLSKPKSPKSMEDMAKFMVWRQEHQGVTFSTRTCEKYGIPFKSRNLTCIVCGKEITEKNRKTCSRECTAEIKRCNMTKPLKVTPCVICGGLVLKRKTCSRPCFLQLMRQNAPKVSPKPCGFCGKEFVPKQQAKTCSRECFKALAKLNTDKRYASGELLGFRTKISQNHAQNPHGYGILHV